MDLFPRSEVFRMKKFAIVASLALLLLFSVPAHSQSTMDEFFVTVGSGVVLQGGGTGFNGGYWYVYPSMWINQWFYDHPFDPTRGKIIHIEFDWIAYDPTCMSDITVAVNWSTPEWSCLGYGETMPPVPDLVGADEDLYIMRHTFVDYCGMAEDLQHVVFDFVIPEYNPEWVSIDVMGCNFEITSGVIIHECAVGNEESSWGAIKTLQR